MERYIIIEGRFEDGSVDHALTKFKKDVNDKIAEGYIPLGSPITETGTPWIAQAMLKLTGDIPFSHYPHPNPLGKV